MNTRNAVIALAALSVVAGCDRSIHAPAGQQPAPQAKQLPLPPGVITDATAQNPVRHVKIGEPVAFFREGVTIKATVTKLAKAENVPTNITAGACDTYWAADIDVDIQGRGASWRDWAENALRFSAVTAAGQDSGANQTPDADQSAGLATWYSQEASPQEHDNDMRHQFLVAEMLDQGKSDFHHTATVENYYAQCDLAGDAPNAVRWLYMPPVDAQKEVAAWLL